MLPTMPDDYPAAGAEMTEEQWLKDLRAEERDMDDEAHAVALSQLPRARRDGGRGRHRRAPRYCGGQLHRDAVFDHAAETVPVRAVVSDGGRDRVLLKPRHLHARVFRVDPGVDAPNLAI